MTEPARDINSSRPFHRTAQAWLDKGHLPFPLKPKGKNPLEKDAYTGKKNPFPKDPQQFVEAQLAKAPHRANIGIWVGPDIICLDIDHYVKDEGTDKEKRYVGHDEYLKLAEELGPLPDTYITTARSDGKSGIRWYRMPEKYINRETLNNTINLSGKAASNIDVVHRGYRFAVVGPSIHPETDSPYRTYAPGVAPDGKSFEATDPFSTEDLPYLPEPWIKFLSKDYTEYSEVDMDMSMQSDKIIDWYRDRMPKGKPCAQVKKSLKYALKELSERSDGHEVLTAADWNLLSLGSEGHPGALAGAKYFEKQYFESMVKRGKRSPSEVKREIFRSRTNAIRKIKAHVDKMEDQGIDVVGKACTCVDLSEIEGAEGSDTPSTIATDGKGTGKTPDEYGDDDRGNAKYFADIYGLNVMFAYDTKRFLHWSGTKWHEDTPLHSRTKAATEVVHRRQEAYAKQLLRIADSLFDPTLPKTQQSADYKSAMAKATKWQKWANRISMSNGFKAFVDYFDSVNENIISMAEFDNNPALFAVANGTLELGMDGQVRLRPQKREDFLLKTSPVDFVVDGERGLRSRGEDGIKGIRAWNDYLDTFITDMDLRRFIQKLFGYAMWGRNHERLMIFFEGESSSGKTVIIELADKVFGPLSRRFEMEALMAKDKDNLFALSLRGARLAFTSEPESDGAINAGYLKKLTGDETLSARPLYTDGRIEFETVFTPFISTNTAPYIPNADAALKRRFCVVPFLHSVGTKDSHKKDILLKYGKEAFLLWCAEGYHMYRTEGLERSSWPKAVTEASDKFFLGLDEFGEFFNETFDQVPYSDNTDDEFLETTVRTDRAFSAYKKWFERNGGGDKEPSANAFGRKMSRYVGASHGHWDKEAGKAKKYYHGIRFKDTGVVHPNFKQGS
ncbi:DNA primase/polymerase [Gordonia phage Genamy16]|uniref:DNA primase/polymerase n=1 Tax=Gordonia phage Genamy16 TaxID=2926104 RepID=A0A9E7Q321_9CAUD|nr:DNA primase/polymerase [Gordonia phage Genamy16]